MPISHHQYAEMLWKLDHSTRSRRHRVPVIGGEWSGVDDYDKESDLHDQIIDYCKNHGWFYVHSRMDKPTTTACGVTDFIIARDDGRTLWIEAKRKGRKLTPAQQGVVHWLERNKQIVAVVYSLEDFIAVSKLP